MQKKADFEKAIKTRYPEQVVIAIAKDKKGRPNPITLGWTMLASGDPPIMLIAVYKGHYSIGALRHYKCFTLSYPSSKMANAALFFGSHSGRACDKFAEFKKCKTSPAKKIDSVLLEDAVANFECKVLGQRLAGDHIIFAGQVVASYVNPKNTKRLFTIAPGHKMGTF